MANPPKKKGTQFENEVLATVHEIWPEASRAEANSESMDLRGTGAWVIECKHRKRWDLFKWIPKIREKAGANPWAIVVAHGDRRSLVGKRVGTVVVLPVEDFAMLLTSEHPHRPDVPTS